MSESVLNAAKTYGEVKRNNSSKKFPNELEENESVVGEVEILKKIINKVPLAISYIDKNLIYRQCNSAAMKALGKKRSEIIGKHLKEITIGQTEVWELVESVLKTGKKQSRLIKITWKERRKEGEKVYKIDYLPDKNKQGETIGVLATGTEVTGQKKAMDKLEKSEARLRKFVDANIVGVFFWDTTGAITYANDAFLKMIGYSRKDLEKNKVDWKKLTPEEYVKRDLEALRDIEEMGHHLPYQKEYIRKDGRRIHILIGTTMVDENRKEGIAFAIDISDQIRVKDKIAESERMFRDLANSMPQLVWKATADGRVDYYNGKYREFSGIRRKGNKYEWAPVLHPDDRERTVIAWKKALKTGEIYEIEHRVKQRNGEYQWFLSRGLPIKDRKGQILKWYGTATNIHKTKLLEQQKDEFIGVASHELKTPLTSIKAYSQIIEGMMVKKGDLKSAEYMKKLNNQITKLTSLVYDLLDATKIQAGKLPLNMATFNLANLLEEVAAEMQLTTDRHKIKLDLQDDTMVVADRDRIRQVLTNLLSNAIKYSPTSSKIIVKMFKQNKNVTTTVQDFGVGIPKERAGKLFQKFFQIVDNGIQQKSGSGLGLGLYISSEIVRRHKGRVWVKSEEGKGSIFGFSIPVKQA